MYSWTEYFGQEIEKIRDKEVGLSRRIKLLTTVTGITYNMTPYLVGPWLSKTKIYQLK